MQLRTGVEAEFALTNSLGIRADFEAGPLTIEQMFNVFPFENAITVVNMSGVEVQEMLDFVARRSASRGCRAQAQVAGIWFDMVCSGDCPGGRTACAKNVSLGENCRAGDPDGPIVSGTCAPLVPTALYRVAVNDFIARGGSGFEVLERNTSKVDTGISLRDALTDFLRDQAPCDAAVVDSTDRDRGTVVERFGAVACLDNGVEPHDGRIRPIFE
jgi:5'-nucleotidase